MHVHFAILLLSAEYHEGEGGIDGLNILDLRVNVVGVLRRKECDPLATMALTQNTVPCIEM